MQVVYQIKMMRTNWLILLGRSAVQSDRNRSRSEGNIGGEVKDVRPILSSITDVWNGR